MATTGQGWAAHQAPEIDGIVRLPGNATRLRRSGPWTALAATRPDAFLPELATSLTIRAHDLHASGRQGKAVAATAEAVEIYSGLIEASPGAYERELKQARQVLERLRGGSSPLLAEFGRRLNGILTDGERQELAALMAVPPSALAGDPDEQCGYLILDWLVRTWLPEWLDLLPAGHGGAASLRLLHRITDTATAEQAAPAVRQAVWVPGMSIGEMLRFTERDDHPGPHPAPCHSGRDPHRHRGTGWDAARLAVPADAPCTALLKVAQDTADNAIRDTIGPPAWHAVQDALDDVPGRRGRRRPARGLAATGERAYKAGVAAAMRHLAPTVLGLRRSVLDLFRDLTRGADPRTTRRYDRARQNRDRHVNHILAAYMASAT